MGLRKYVRQVRPIQENHIKPEIKVQTLLNEASEKGRFIQEDIIKQHLFLSQQKVSYLEKMVRNYLK